MRKQDLNIIFQKIIEYYTTIQPGMLTQIQRGVISIKEFETDATKIINSYKVSKEDVDKLLYNLKTFLFGYFKLTPLLDDDDISDIRCHNAKNIRVKKFGKRYATNIKFHNNDEYSQFLKAIAIKNQRDLSMINAQQVFTDVDTHDKFRLRFDMSTSLLNSSKLPTLHIRKIPKEKKTYRDLMNAYPVPMMDEDVSKFMANQIRGNQSMIVGGPNAAGKTTFINANLELYPQNLAGTVIQESDELFSKTHPDLYFKLVIAPNGEGKISYSIKDEIKHALMSDNDLIVIGEVKGDEALDVINAAYTGSTCWLATHGESSQDCAEKIADYAVAAAKYGLPQILKRLAAMNIVVFIKDYQIKEISKITGIDNETQSLTYELIYSKDKGFKNFEPYYVKEVETEAGELKFNTDNDFMYDEEEEE